MENNDMNGSTIAKGNRLFWGLLCLLLGVALLVNVVFRIDIFSMRNMWPLFVLIPGLCLESTYFTTRRASALLIPGGILTVIGLLFFFETITRWQLAQYTWPVYIAAVAFGFFQFYLANGKPKEILVLVSILSIVAGTAMLVILLNVFIAIIQTNVIVSLALILIGTFLIFSGLFRKPR